MRVSVLPFLIILVAACAPRSGTAPASFVDPPPTTPAHPAAVPHQDLTPESEVPSPPETPKATRGSFSNITFEGIAFDSRSHRLLVIDQDAGPGSRYPDAATAGRTHGGLAASNAGFFTPAGKPLGLVVSSGKRSGAWNSASSLGSGLWHESPNGDSAIARRETLGRTRATRMLELIQAGPMLIDNRQSVSGLNSSKSSIRTLLLWDGHHRWWLGRASSCTLASLGNTLRHAAPAGWNAQHALNLDGGRSSDLWISPRIQGGPVTKRPLWNRPVRNFLVLKPR